MESQEDPEAWYYADEARREREDEAARENTRQRIFNSSAVAGVAAFVAWVQREGTCQSCGCTRENWRHVPSVVFGGRSAHDFESATPEAK